MILVEFDSPVQALVTRVPWYARIVPARLLELLGIEPEDPRWAELDSGRDRRWYWCATERRVEERIEKRIERAWSQIGPAEIATLRATAPPSG